LPRGDIKWGIPLLQSSRLGEGHFFADKMPNHWRVGFDNGNSHSICFLPVTPSVSHKKTQLLLPILAVVALCHLQTLE
jgi:hypothetical protein